MNDLEDRVTRELFALADTTPPSRLTTERVRSRVRQRQRRRVIVRNATVGSLAVLTLVGMAAIARTRRDRPGDDAHALYVQATPPPLIALDAPGWKLDYFADTSTQAPLVAYVDARLGFAGPSFVVERTSDQQEGRTVDVGGVSGTITGEGGTYRSLMWTTAGGDKLVARSYDIAPNRLPESELIAAAAGVTIQPDGTAFTSHVPPGMKAAEAGATALLARYAEYQLSNGSRTLQVSFYGGGNLDSRAGGEPRDAVRSHGQPALVTPPAAEAPGRFRLNFTDRFWVWEIDGDGFANRQAFLDLAERVHVVDEATWRATLPADAVTSDKRTNVVDEMLTDIPLPPGFDTTSLQSGPANDRYQLTAQVTGAVFCAWVRVWNDALDSGDTAGAERAQKAMASSHNWPALINMTGGAFNSVLWDYADRVANGDRSVVAQLAKGLGCAT